MGILGSEYQWAHLERCQPRVSFAQLKRKRGRGVVRRPLPTKRESRALWVIPGYPWGFRSSTILVYTRGIDICWVHQVINVFLPLSGHQQFFVYTRSSTILRLYQLISDSLFITGRSELFTPVGSASSACTLQRSDFWAVCVCGAWASAIHAYGTILGSEFPPTVQSLGCPQW